MKIHQVLLFPLAVLYDLVTRLRNRMYDTGVRPSAAFEVPVIAVGNLSVGGTGKSPMIEYLIRLLGERYKLATLSRGYGRKTKGIRFAGEHDDASTLGDEPFQFYRKFKKKAIVAVGEERAFAIPHILQEHPETQVILLDDAFQHRRVKPRFQILLTEYHRLFTRDFVLPAGRLRESKRGAARANVIVVTKCPKSITEEDMMSVERMIRGYSRKAVFFSSISYGNLLSPGKTAPYKPEKIVVVSGIADPAPLMSYLQRHYEVRRHFSFADHHTYTQADMKRICEVAAKEEASVITTEKDVVKLDVSFFDARDVCLFYLPIETHFIKNGKEFDEMVLNAASPHGN